MSKLIVIGSGIKAISHFTKESEVVLRSADKVYFLSNDPVTTEWLLKQNPTAESLYPLYCSFENRADAYQSICDYLVSEYTSYNCTVLVLYGHPIFFTDIGLKVVHEIRAQKGFAILLPAISSLDCLLADLLINPTKAGLSIHDATEFFVHDRTIDTTTYLVLYQISSLLTSDYSISKCLAKLQTKLLNFYAPDQDIYIYRSAQYPTQLPDIRVTKINQINDLEVDHVSTLCIPPKNQKLAHL